MRCALGAFGSAFRLHRAPLSTLVLLLPSALFAFVPFPPPLPLPLRPPPREGLGVAAFDYAYMGYPKISISRDVPGYPALLLLIVFYSTT